jgi:hypothetical protein
MGEGLDILKQAIAQGIPITDAHKWGDELPKYKVKNSHKRKAEHQRAETKLKKRWKNASWGNEKCNEELLEVAADYVYDGTYPNSDRVDQLPSMAGLCMACGINTGTGIKWMRDPSTPNEKLWQRLCYTLSDKQQQICLNASRERPEGPDTQIAIRVLASKHGYAEKQDITHGLSDEIKRLNEFDRKEAERLGEIRLKQICDEGVRQLPEGDTDASSK